MSQPISLRDLVRPQTVEDEQQGARLSPSHESALPQWQAAGLRIAEQMSAALSTPTGCDVEVTLVEHRTLRTSEKSAGLLFPIAPEASGAFVRLPSQSARVLTALLLHSPIDDDEDAEPEAVDAELADQLLEILSETIDEALGLSVMRVDGEPLRDWPLTPPPLGPKLMVRFTLSFGEGQSAALEVLFPTTEEKAMLRLSGTQGQVDPALVILEAEATLARWRTRAEILGKLGVGSTVALPGANQATVRLETMSDGEPATLLHGKLGEINGRRTLTITAEDPDPSTSRS